MLLMMLGETPLVGLVAMVMKTTLVNQRSAVSTHETFFHGEQGMCASVSILLGLFQDVSYFMLGWC